MNGELIPCEAVIDIVASNTQAKLIAIDGLPCSGKSTLAKNLCKHFDYGYLEIDNFFIDTKEWPPSIQPNFPFPFFRHKDLNKVLKSLHETGSAEYNPFDWDNMKPGDITVQLTTFPPLIVEGIGILGNDTAHYFDLKFFVESDSETVLEAVLKRDGDFFINEWKNMFLPCNTIYMDTQPQTRANYRVAGRNIGFTI